MQKSGSTCELYSVKGLGHGLRGWESAKGMTAYKNRMVSWLGQELKPPKADHN
jgi:hypothetical protein